MSHSQATEGYNTATINIKAIYKGASSGIWSILTRPRSNCKAINRAQGLGLSFYPPETLTKKRKGPFDNEGPQKRRSWITLVVETRL
jgi:hypothetical protein